MNEGIKIIIFGVGQAGKDAFDFIGEKNVYCFADNKKYGEYYMGKQVLSFDDLKSVYENSLIIIASYNYASEIEEQLDRVGMIFHMTYTRDSFWRDRSLFSYFVKGEWNSFSYRQLFGYFNLEKYSKISIYTSSDRFMLLMLMIILARLQNKVRYL